MGLTPTLITLVVSTVELLVCLGCTILLWRGRRATPDHSRLMLCLGAAHCVVTCALKYVLIFTSPEQNLYHEALSPATSQWGMLSVLLLLAYAVAVIRPEWLRTWPRVLLYLAPGLLLMVAHHVFTSWHRLYSFADVCQQATEPDVLFRLMQLPIIAVYCLLMLFLMVNIRQTGLGSLWVRRYILCVIGLLLLVSAFSIFHFLPLHYLHQLCVAAFCGYWTYYELCDRTYTAPVSEELRVKSEKLTTAILSPANRFITFDTKVDRERLYVRPDLSRDDYAKLMGVDRTTFSRIIAEQSGCQNLADYLNKKRMAYAVELMRQYPNYTLQAIMEDCGYRSKMTFNRVFKDTYSTTPSDYRKQLS